MTEHELIQLMDFILDNSEPLMKDSSLFTMDTLMKIRAIVRKKMPNNLGLSKEQEELLFKVFKDKGCVFNEDTPIFMTRKEDYIIASIEKDVNSMNYIRDISDKIKELIISEAIRQGYVIKENSANFLKQNLKIATNSIRLDKSSADYISWSRFNRDEKKLLINLLLEQGYILNIDSPLILRENKDIVLASIEKDVNRIQYAVRELRNDPQIFKILLLNDYCDDDAIEYKKLSLLNDEEILDYYLSKYKFHYDEGHHINTVNIFNERVKQIFKTMLNDKPLIKNFDSILKMTAEREWNNYKKEHAYMYQNLFSKICGQLQSSSNYDVVTNELDFLPKMIEILDKKGEMFNNTIKEYHRIYHDLSIEDKISALEPLKDIISKCAALYISKSKDIFKKEATEKYLKIIKPFYGIKLGNAAIKKKIIHARQREKLKILYGSVDGKIFNQAKIIINKYSNQLDHNRAWTLLGFIISGHTEINDFTKAPERYEEYVTFEEASKLVNRLNSSYITFNGVEVKNHKHLIGYNEETGKYYYSGREFSQEEINSFNVYKNLSIVFDKLKKDVIMMSKNLEVNEEISAEELLEIKSDLQFTDENYEFILSKALDEVKISHIMDTCIGDVDLDDIASFVDDKSFSSILNLLYNNNLLWLMLIMEYTYNEYNVYSDEWKIADCLGDNGIEKEEMAPVISSMPKIISLAENLKIDITSISELVSLQKLSECANESEIAILGREIIERLFMDTEYTDGDDEKIIRIAKELVCDMAKRSHSTVPYVSGEYSNYKYSMYDPQDENILLSGLNTDACFRVCGNDNDFIHYCALDKNGFVLKITDSFGNFIGRASGFRNGNAIYMNQLRTIYDVGGNNYTGKYKSEKLDIINTFIKACEDIIRTSQNNQAEEKKIDFAFITKSYSLSKIRTDLSKSVINHIGNMPMDTESQDWQIFENSTKNLRGKNGFATDYGHYPLICRGGIKEDSDIEISDIKREDVPALYERKRNSITVQNQIDPLIIRKINRVKAINSYYEDTKFSEVNIPEGSVVYTGDNWFIISSNGEIINECLLVFDEKAKIEFEETKKMIEDSKVRLLSINPEKPTLVRTLRV